MGYMALCIPNFSEVISFVSFSEEVFFFFLKSWRSFAWKNGPCCTLVLSPCEAAKLWSPRAAWGHYTPPMPQGSLQSPKTFLGASFLRWSRVTCTGSWLQSSRHDVLGWLGLAFPGPLPPPALWAGTSFGADIAWAPPIWRSRGSEIRGFLCLLTCASILSCLAGLPALLPILPFSAVF